VGFAGTTRTTRWSDAVLPETASESVRPVLERFVEPSVVDPVPVRVRLEMDVEHLPVPRAGDLHVEAMELRLSSHERAVGAEVSLATPFPEIGPSASTVRPSVVRQSVVHVPPLR
jgi:hypothetical protein